MRIDAEGYCHGRRVSRLEPIHMATVLLALAIFLIGDICDFIIVCFRFRGMSVNGVVHVIRQLIGK